MIILAGQKKGRVPEVRQPILPVFRLDWSQDHFMVEVSRDGSKKGSRLLDWTTYPLGGGALTFVVADQGRRRVDFNRRRQNGRSRTFDP
jgi:hypothetical protein